ncbi:hypothetical protein CLTEP_21460 [Clostridium tepidiprofundi DSM 19306]|uniref:Uncharacterized protein n=1 Tax=Clostridium tepidiprofundi DSM 19306 TaxID=1121338 RepID=A0A151B063_9CLOT|nr:hypothetical protein [Clostridium tepidiprofundi]KYH33288.1 hypothetical protein CLTEP_21460 [Clostridium tepidiprofundi DSM 19306]
MMKNFKKIIIILSIIIFLIISYNIWQQQKHITINEKIANTTKFSNKKRKSYDDLNYKRDLNKDGTKEEISIIFKHMENNSMQNYTITINTKGKKYTFKKDDIYNVFPKINFADFDINDKYIEFYIESDGPSDDPNSTIYRFDNDIKEICNIPGTIVSYDGFGKIYTTYSKTNDKYKVLLSYYDINEKKFVFNDKNNLIGKNLQYNNSLILFTDSADTSGVNKVICNSIIDNNMQKKEIQKLLDRYNKETIVKVCKPNEILTIVDIDNTYHGNFKNGNPKNIRIKVRTNDNKEGWLDWLNGGD